MRRGAVGVELGGDCDWGRDWDWDWDWDWDFLLVWVGWGGVWSGPRSRRRTREIIIIVIIVIIAVGVETQSPHRSGVERLPARRGQPVRFQPRVDFAPVASPVTAKRAEVATRGVVDGGVVERRRLRLLLQLHTENM